MTPDQRRALEPWALMYARLERRLEAMSDDELGEFYRTLTSASQTNCWCAAYRAAQMLIPAVQSQCGERTMKKLKSMDQQT